MCYHYIIFMMKKVSLILVSICFAFLSFNYIHATSNVKNQKIKILIVPGHDDEIWGAQYGNIKEADMNLALSNKLMNILKKDKRFDVYITRNWDGYTKTFSNYFANERDEIISFRDNAKKETKNNIESGIYINKENEVPHVGVKEETSIKLYGINKWANENKIDAVIHVHFNDYPRNNKWEIGKYKGFCMYTPEEQFENSIESNNLAKKIFKELKKSYSTSTYEKESLGILPEQGLIAIGANSTLEEDTLSVLIEYGYIYRFKDYSFRQKSYEKMSSLTYKGLVNYFFPK